MCNSKETSFRNNCRMMLGGHITNNTTTTDATIAPIAGVEMIPKYRIITFKNGLGAIQRIKK